MVGFVVAEVLVKHFSGGEQNIWRTAHQRDSSESHLIFTHAVCTVRTAQYLFAMADILGFPAHFALAFGRVTAQKAERKILIFFIGSHFLSTVRRIAKVSSNADFTPGKFNRLIVHFTAFSPSLHKLIFEQFITGIQSQRADSRRAIALQVIDE
ncbi:hypothetical protein D3C84_831060 [compost metagenome]